MRTLLKDRRIKIFTRSFDLRLYSYAKELFDGIDGIQTVRLTDQTADGYFYTMLKDTSCDIAINIDEDAFLTGPKALLDLVEYVILNGYANAGCQDGGAYAARAGNPLVTNPFFNVLNLELIRTKFSRDAIREFDSAGVIPRMKADFPQELLTTPYNFEWVDYEPYFKFFIWLAYNFKTLYLPSGRYKDGITTILYNQNHEELCYHTWMARFYSVPDFFVRFFQKNTGMQKHRIEHVISMAYADRNMLRPDFSLVQKLSFFGNKIARWCIKVPQRVAGWPRKISKKYKKLRSN
ncbi:MAG: hypothetical protein PHD07_00885 [Bacteroidales bacterium]|nr:hypothetical protein [Bacteroidales bacterium]MDD3200515.1 hypothetical protein [Bacteroidales bacterium]